VGRRCDDRAPHDDSTSHALFEEIRGASDVSLGIVLCLGPRVVVLWSRSPDGGFRVALGAAVLVFLLFRAVQNVSVIAVPAMWSTVARAT